MNIMNITFVRDTKRLVEESIETFLDGDSVLIEELNECFDEIESQLSENKKARIYLESLSEAVKDGDRWGCIESMSLICLPYIDTSTVNSNFDDIVSLVIKKIRKHIFSEKERYIDSLSPSELIEKNVNAEVGTFLFYLYEYGEFRRDQFDVLCGRIRSSKGEELSTSNLFILYADFVRHLNYHLDINDGYCISDIENSELHEYMQAFRDVITEKIKDS